MGTFETKFTIPDLTTEPRFLPISSVVLSNQREKLDAAVATAERDRRLLTSDPLVQDGVKLIPSVTRVFKKDQDMYVYLEAYEPTAETTQPLVATVSFYRGKIEGFRDRPAAGDRRVERQAPRRCRCGSACPWPSCSPAGTRAR